MGLQPFLLTQSMYTASPTLNISHGNRNKDLCENIAFIEPDPHKYTSHWPAASALVENGVPFRKTRNCVSRKSDDRTAQEYIDMSNDFNSPVPSQSTIVRWCRWPLIQLCWALISATEKHLVLLFDVALV